MKDKINLEMAYFEINSEIFANTIALKAQHFMQKNMFFIKYFFPVLGRIFPKQCFGSGSRSTWIRIQLVGRIQIGIQNADLDPDQEGLKRAEKKKINEAKRQIVMHKKPKHLC
jgi:hypothetical protein